MKHSRRIAICLAGGLVIPTGADAASKESPGHPYSVIVAKNTFRLTPVPLQPAPPETVLPPPPKITLTGVLKYGPRKEVFFKIAVAAKPGDPPKETTFTLGEGESGGDVEILEINEVTGAVHVRNHGREQSLSLAKDGMKPPGTTGTGPAAIPAVSTTGVSAPPLSPEEQVVVMEINRRLTADKVARGELPPLPETGFVPNPASQ